MATEASRSFRQADGSIVKRFYGDPVNVKDSQGRWRHIDTDLARDGATLKAKTTRVPVTLPKDLTDAPVTVGSPGQAASVSPVGLAGTATVDGDTASYVDRSRDVETRLAALPDGVKQSYVLRNENAPSRLDMALRVSAGFSVRKADDGGATIVDADGKTRFELSPTFAWPKDELSKARPVPTEIVRDGDAWRVRLDLSSRWIRKALEHGPVVVDPTLSVPSPVHDAVINSEFPTYNAGWSTAMGFVATAWKQASPPIEFRSLLRFDLHDLPQDADVLSATIGLHVAPHSPVPPSTGIDIAMHEATSAWESDAATWISRLPTASWTVPGGDYVGSAVATATDVRQTDGWREWGVTSLVRRWASGASANNGVVLKAASVSPEEIYFPGRTATGAYADQKPYLQVHYAPPAEQPANNPGTGDTGFFTFRPSTAIGGTQINVASGNLLVRTRDLADSAGNFHVVVDRAYNSLAPDTFSILSPRWGFDVGPATRIVVQGNGDALVTGPSGYKLRFVKQTDGTFTAPTDFDGSLVKTSSGWTLNRTSQNDQFGFDNSGTLTWTKDSQSRDFTVQGTSAAGRDVLSSYGTSLGQRVNLSYTGDSLVREMDDPSSGHHYYRYTNGRLTAYESPTGQITSYRYDSNGLLDKITEPGGTTVELDVAPSGRVRSITTTLPGGVPQTTSFVYTRRPYKSDVTGPDNVRRTYAYDADWRVTRQYNPDEVPSVTASAELRDLAGGYVGPHRTYPVNVAATQPDGAGLRRLWLTLVPENELAGQNVPCTTTPFDLVCPQTYDVPLDIDFAPLPEGPTTLRGAALDDEQNRGNSAAWQVTVDKTAPVDIAASGELFDAHDGYINGQGTKSVTVSAVDPDMANGTRLSGIKRLQLEDVGHGIVATADVSCTALACPVTASETLSVDAGPLVEGAHQLRVVATDLVGNVSRSAPWTVNVDKTSPTSPDPSSLLGGRFDNGEAEITWEPGTDPPLADGGDPSGEFSTLIRTRAPVGVWSGWAETDELTHNMPTGTPATVEVELRTVDAVGNVGPVVSGSVTFDTDETDDCDARNTSHPDSECDALAASEPFDSEDDLDVELEVDDIFDDDAASRTANPARRYWVTSKSELCDEDGDSKCWTTTRYFPQSFATGNMRMVKKDLVIRARTNASLRPKLDKRARFWRTYFPNSSQAPKTYYGYNGTSDVCAWIARGSLVSGAFQPATAPCSDDPKTTNRYWNYVQRRAKPKSNAVAGELLSVPVRPRSEKPVWVNCFWDGEDHDEPARLMPKKYWGQYGLAKAQHCNPSNIRLEKPTDTALKAQMTDQPLAFCANVFTNRQSPYSARLNCRGEDRLHEDLVQKLKDGEKVLVGWRYVVRGRRWVMVAVPGRTGSRAHWVFVPRYLFPKDVADWPGRGAKPAGLSYGQ